MLVRLLILLCFVPALGFSQATDNTFYNKGADVYVQLGALLHVQGSITNDNGSANGIIENTGVIELKGDFDNKPGASFTTDPFYFSPEKVVRFIGDGKQRILGDMASPTASFFNIVVAQLDADSLNNDTLELGTNVNVDGSLHFGSNTVNSIYSPGMSFPNQGTNGIVKTYNATDEYTLNLKYGSQEALVGYASLDTMLTSPKESFVLTKGTRGSQNGGFTRYIPSTGGSFDFPIGTTENGFNGVRLNFSSVPGTGGVVKGKFCDGTSSARGYVGTINQQCIGCGGQNPDNTGFNYYSANNPCTNDGQWAIFEESGILDHGYWSFDADGNNNGDWKYVIEVFPNSFQVEGDPNDSWRVIKYHDNTAPAGQEFGVDPSDLTVNWGSQILNVENPSDLFTYTRFGTNPAACYQGNGVPGGVYTDFSHFSMHKSNSGSALPVELISLKADAIENKFIQVSWATAMEINNNGFEVLRSKDGLNFTNVGWVDGHDNSTVQNNYTFDDHDVAPNVVYYYKLRQVDNDGSSEETYIVSAAITSGDVFVISDLMPNPTKDISKFTITTSTALTIDVKVYDNIGRIVLDNQSYNLTQGQNNIVVNGSNFAAGTYNIIISTGNDVYSKKLVVNQQ